MDDVLCKTCNGHGKILHRTDAPERWAGFRDTWSECPDCEKPKCKRCHDSKTILSTEFEPKLMGGYRHSNIDCPDCTKAKCATCDGSGKYQNTVEISYNDGAPSQLLKGDVVVCEDCTQAEVKVCDICKKPIEDYEHMRGWHFCKKDTSPAEQCKAKIDAVLRECGFAITVGIYEGIVQLELKSTYHKKIVLGRIAEGEKYFNYNGKTEVSE